jgi:serine/threonine protein kinase
VHRDLKPSNILLGGDGRPRVMDFGIAARVQRGSGERWAHDGRVVGTSGYISPEAARGEPPQPAMDVFAAGVMLGEMLSGVPLLKERDPSRAIQRVQSEDLTIAAGGDVDEGLRAIVLRSLSRDAAHRFDTARAMHEALTHWLDPGQQTLDTSHATLEFLLRRMRHKSDFPALSSSVLRIQKLTGSDTESLRTLSEEILKDVSLTNKLLQFSNGAMYPIAGMPLWEAVHDLKLEALEDIIEESMGQPIFCSYSFRSDAERIMERFRSLRPINLTECKSERSLTDAMFRWRTGDCQLMIGHSSSMGHGVDGLQQMGHTLVWYGLNWSLDLYEQFNARIRRQGQGHPVICHRILCRDTLDQAQALALNDKATTQNSLRSAIKSYRSMREKV